MRRLAATAFATALGLPAMLWVSARAIFQLESFGPGAYVFLAGLLCTFTVPLVLWLAARRDPLMALAPLLGVLAPLPGVVCVLLLTSALATDQEFESRFALVKLAALFGAVVGAIVLAAYRRWRNAI